MKTLLPVIAVLASALPLSAELKVGDPAPDLKVERWLKGDPVRLSDGKDKNVFVVEFWATECGRCAGMIPRLTKLQKRFEKAGVVVIGITIDGDETRKNVEGFVKDLGSKMAYRVALDDGEATQKAFMEAAGVEGHPHSFLIGKDGKIAWHGDPLDGLDLKVANLVGDKEYAAQTEKAKTLRIKLVSARRQRDWDGALKAIDDLLALEPCSESYHYQKYRILAAEKKDREAAARVGPQAVASISDAEVLNEMAWSILTDEDFEGARDLKLALAAAKKANDLSGGKEYAILDTYARALFDTGNRTEALATQKKAVELAEKEKAPSEQLNELKENLGRYAKADGKAGGGKEKE